MLQAAEGGRDEGIPTVSVDTAQKMSTEPARTDLDVASAAPWHPAALATFRRVAAELPADPTRRYREGRAAADLLSSARSAVATVLGTAPERMLFTSGGTEAIHLAVLGSARANRTRAPRIVSCAVEHSAVLAAAEASGLAHILVDVDSSGRIDLDALEQALRGGAVLCSVQHANHEIGTIQPLQEVAALCREHDVALHVDACQTVGRLPVNLDGLGADLLSASAAKFGGGRGVGLLAWSPRARFAPLHRGDEREHRRRAGLQNLPGIAALAETLLQLAPHTSDGPAAEEASRADTLRRRLRTQLTEAVADVEVHGADEPSLPHLVAASALYVDGEALVSALDAAGYAVHSGSSCATTSGEPSHVLVATGGLTHGHVRVSFGPDVGAEELDAFVLAYAEAVTRLRARADPSR